MDGPGSLPKMRKGKEISFSVSWEPGIRRTCGSGKKGWMRRCLTSLTPMRCTRRMGISISWERTRMRRSAVWRL